ncbi:MAG: VRR-NUC domain-containing protein [Gammaproteobacteria bacterium]|nr:VRR-NUC domain-containing protein [Gammaproteobacteria bacterium]
MPTFYYHGHFVEMLDFIDEHYSHVLLPEHVSYISGFRTLSSDAQCMYVRLVNRKGRVFAADRLRYPELGDQVPLLRELRDFEWIGKPRPAQFYDMLTFLTRREIYDVLLPRVAGLSRSLKKAELVQFALEHIEAVDFIAALKSERLLVQRRVTETRFLLFLYFGRVQDGLSKFTLRDLGLVQTRSSRESYEPRFCDREEALETFYFADRLQLAKKTTTGQLQALISEVAEWPSTNFSSSASLRDKLAYALGRESERAGDLATAVQLYEQGETAQCSEKVMRLLLASGQRDEARQRLEQCIDLPRSDEEYLVARDIYQRKFEKKRTSAVTDILRLAEVIEIDESRSGAPERAAVEHYERLGLRAFRTENLLWRALFGLLFWDELFDGDCAPSNSPFDWLPASLKDGSFYQLHRESLDRKLACVHGDSRSVKLELLRVSTRFYGQVNGVFRWRRSTNEALFALLDADCGPALARMLKRLCQDYTGLRYGYPDLLVIDDIGARFVEIKTDGDQVRRNQLLRIEQLREAGFRADVVRIEWTLDPQQVYVVVDVETTGGRGDSHRVTEIGAVKLQDGEIIDRFQTLLNPQRLIPANITRLTGISPAMVANAPYFPDIADEFLEFMTDAIFVAHNVEFDYGFISREYRRIGRSFRFPKLCTCASMRKLYPGYRSYSLAALCQHFDIKLKHHHRALCDAEAAAELLLLVNEKRQQRWQDGQ